MGRASVAVLVLAAVVGVVAFGGGPVIDTRGLGTCCQADYECSSRWCARPGSPMWQYMASERTNAAITDACFSYCAADVYRPCKHSFECANHGCIPGIDCGDLSGPGAVQPLECGILWDPDVDMDRPLFVDESTPADVPQGLDILGGYAYASTLPAGSPVADPDQACGNGVADGAPVTAGTPGLPNPGRTPIERCVCVPTSTGGFQR